MKKKKKGVGKKKLLVAQEKIRDLSSVEVQQAGGGLAGLSGTCCVAGTTCGTTPNCNPSFRPQ